MKHQITKVLKKSLPIWIELVTKTAFHTGQMELVADYAGNNIIYAAT